MSVEAVLFDFDMTLVDSSYSITLCTNVLAEAKGVRKVDRKEVLAVIGLPILDSWRALWGDVIGDDWLDFYRAECRDAEEKHFRLFPGTLETLRGLRAAGYKVGVVSNRRYARVAVEAVSLQSEMDIIVGLEDVGEPKPNPEALFYAADKLGVDPASVVYVGDTDIDMKTAVAARIPGIGVTTGNFAGDALKSAGASHTCDDLREIPAVLQLFNETGDISKL